MKGDAMIAIEIIPDIWFEVDPRKVDLPQDGQRLVSSLEQSFKTCLADWLAKNYRRERESSFEAFCDMAIELLARGEILHEFETTFTPISTKRRIAAVTNDRNGNEVHFGNWYTKKDVDVEN